MIDKSFLEENQVVIFSNPSYEKALVAVWEDNDCNYHAVYDYDKMVECLMEEDGMTDEEAMDFISYNTIRSLPYVEKAPIIINMIV